MIVTQDGVLIRTEVGGISTVGRNTQGVRVINLGEGDRVIDMTQVPKDKDNLEADESSSEDSQMADEGTLEESADSAQTPSEGSE